MYDLVNLPKNELSIIIEKASEAKNLREDNKTEVCTINYASIYPFNDI